MPRLLLVFLFLILFYYFIFGLENNDKKKSLDPIKFMSQLVGLMS